MNVFNSAASFLVVGLSLGFVVGLSESPAASMAIQALIGIPAASFGYLQGLKQVSAENGDRIRAGAVLLAFLASGLAGGVPLGVIVRTHELLVDQTRDDIVVVACKPAWPSDFCVETMMQDLLLDRLGVPEEGQEAWRATLSNCDWEDASSDGNVVVVDATHPPSTGLPSPADLFGAAAGAESTNEFEAPTCYRVDSVPRLRTGMINVLTVTDPMDRADAAGVGAKSGLE